MTETTPTRPRIPPITYLGLCIALFAMLLVRQIVNHIWPAPTITSAITKELGMWLSAIALLLIVKCGERLTFSSIGLGNTRWSKSILWGVIISLICFLAAGALIALTHYTGGESGKAMDKLPLWLVALIVIRAGVVEELCYRGYAIERLQSLGLPS